MRSHLFLTHSRTQKNNRLCAGQVVKSSLTIFLQKSVKYLTIIWLLLMRKRITGILLQNCLLESCLNNKLKKVKGGFT